MAKRTKTAKTGKRPALKKTAAARNKDEVDSTKAVKSSRGRKSPKKMSVKKPAVPGDKTSVRPAKPKGALTTADSARSRPTAGETVSSKRKGVTELKVATGKKEPKTARSLIPAGKPARTPSRAPKPWIKSPEIRGELSFKRKSAGIRKVKAGVPKKDLKADRPLSLGGTGAKSPSPELPQAIREIQPAGLPEEYGENEFFLIPVEPRVVYASWEITRDSLPDDKGGLKVRFFEVKKRRGKSSSGPFLETAINKRVGDAFFNVGIHGREIIAEIGHEGADGRFRPILRSRRVLIPSSLTPDEPLVSLDLPGTDNYGSRPPDG